MTPAMQRTLDLVVPPVTLATIMLLLPGAPWALWVPTMLCTYAMAGTVAVRAHRGTL